MMNEIPYVIGTVMKKCSAVHHDGLLPTVVLICFASTLSSG